MPLPARATERGTTIDATLQLTLLTAAAAVLSYSLWSGTALRRRSLSTGLLLGAALLYALPQAFEGTANHRSLCATLLAGLLAFFLLEKCATLHRAANAGWLCSSLAAAGGLAGYLALARGVTWMPYMLVLASSGFLYIALSDLIPKIQQPAPARDTAMQLLLLGAGVTLVLYLPGRAPAY